ncbi:hypothetical protein EV401DRAFT_2200748 [Pisolithus croceorrhizus]|nr:hypothetical protein EV401DRAFT_2200748 [Pisolithus croceorrhizus]
MGSISVDWSSKLHILTNNRNRAQTRSKNLCIKCSIKLQVIPTPMAADPHGTPPFLRVLLPLLITWGRHLVCVGDNNRLPEGIYDMSKNFVLLSACPYFSAIVTRKSEVRAEGKEYVDIASRRCTSTATVSAPMGSPPAASPKVVRLSCVCYPAVLGVRRFDNGKWNCNSQSPRIRADRLRGSSAPLSYVWHPESGSSRSSLMRIQARTPGLVIGELDILLKATSNLVNSSTFCETKLRSSRGSGLVQLEPLLDKSGGAPEKVMDTSPFWSSVLLNGSYRISLPSTRRVAI